MRIGKDVNALIEAGTFVPGAWHPVPEVTDRAAWETIPPASAEQFAADARAALAHPWPSMPATLWLAYARAGRRLPYETPYFARRDRLATAIVAAAGTRDQALLDDVVDGLWAICEETAWQVPAHDRSRSAGDHGLPKGPVVDLFAAETAAALAWAVHVLGPDLDEAAPSLREHVVEHIKTRVLRAYTAHTDWFWFARGSNNWNPWIHSNLIAAALLVEDDPQHLNALLRQAAQGLDNYVAELPADGGCDEGVDYWWRAGASLCEALEWLRSASDGVFDPFTDPMIAAVARYPMVVHLAGPWHVNFADGSARSDRASSRNGANPRLLAMIGHRVGDPDLIRHARALRGGNAVVSATTSPGRLLPALFDAHWAEEEPASFPLPSHSWLPEIEVLTARHRDGSSEGPFLAIKGGHNAESHNHNDVGSFVLAYDGDPIVVDAGVGEYTRKTFSDRRYDIWTMRSTHHNLPEVNGAEQQPGREFAASDVHAGQDETGSWFSAEIGGAYHRESGIESWQRHARLDREHGSVLVQDTWHLQADPDDLCWHLILREPPEAQDDGSWLLRGEHARMHLHVDQPVDDEYEVIVIDDVRMTPVWGDHLVRMTLRPRSTGARGSLGMRFTAAD